MSATGLTFTISTFPIGKSDGPAYGQHTHTTWGELEEFLRTRREGEKDGPCFTASTFQVETVSKSGVETVRRLKANVTSRTLIALDIETNKKTGEVPPALTAAMSLAAAQGWACAGYTSHNHQPDIDERYRLLLPMTVAVVPDLPCPEVVAARLGLAGVLDTSKVGASSVFYLPSCPPGRSALHQSIAIEGAPLDTLGVTRAAKGLQHARQLERERIAAKAHAEAAKRRAERLAAGFDPEDSLIERLRAHFDLAAVLQAHGYDQAGTKFRHPASSSGMYGADIKTFAGIERVFSHNATDPLHADNLPDWCGTVTALDVFDVVAILDFGGDRRRALRELSNKHGLNKAAERKELSRLLFRLLRRRTPQTALEAAAYAEGARLGLSQREVNKVAQWVAEQAAGSKAA